MREIKFRAWHVEEKCFVRDFILDDRGNYYITDHSEYMGDDRKLIIMQFTGLKDKNGKEIYEGDIVLKGVRLGGVDKYVITWVNDSTGFFLKSKNMSFALSALCKIEILGNIYENPELLNRHC